MKTGNNHTAVGQNWWGVTDENGINYAIDDGRDDVNHGLVIYETPLSDRWEVVECGGHCPSDGDCDGVSDDVDNCRELANADQMDKDQDGVGDACDNCPGAANPDQEDADADGTGDACKDVPVVDEPGAELVTQDETLTDGDDLTGSFVDVSDALKPCGRLSSPAPDCGAANGLCALATTVFLASFRNRRTRRRQ